MGNSTIYFEDFAKFECNDVTLAAITSICSGHRQEVGVGEIAKFTKFWPLVVSGI